MRAPGWGVVALALLLASPPPAAHAAERLRLAQAAVGAEEAAAVVRAASGGRVLDVRLEGSVYRVRVLLEGGRVRTYRVDAATGQVLP